MTASLSSVFCVLLALTLLAGQLAQAQAVPYSFSYQGRAFDTNGTSPLLRTVDIKLQIRSSNGACLLYEEQQSGINLSATNGYFSLNVGSIVGDSKRTGSDPSLSMTRVFSNAGQVRASSTDCVGGYTPAAGDKRRLRVTIVDNGVSTTLNPDQDITSVPYATVAETLQGVSASGFIQVSGAVTQSNLSDLLAKKTELLSLVANESALSALASGSSALYVKPSAGGVSLTGTGNIALSPQKSLQLGTYSTAQQSTFVGSLTAADRGKTWYNSDTNMIMYWDGASSKALGSATAITSFNGSTQVAQSLAMGSDGMSPAWVTDAASGTHTLNLPLASTSGVTAGLVSNAEYTALASKAYSDANLAGKALSAPTVAEDGQSLRWNNAAQAWEYFSAGTGSVQTTDPRLSPSLAGDNSDALKMLRVNSAGTAYELRTPAEVVSDLGLGTASTADASTFLTKSGNLSGLASAATARSNLGLTATGDALATSADASAARTTLGLGGAALLNVGTAAGTVAAGDDARISGALPQSTFNGYVSPVSGASACTSGQTMYWNSVSSSFACATISIAASQITSGTISAARLPAASSSADGIVTQTAQTFAGDKTFANNVAVTGSLSVGGVALTTSQIEALQALATRNSAGTSCSASETLSTDSSGTVLACVSGTWQVTGGSAASLPTSFSFTDQAGLAFSTLACSNVVTVSGLNIPVYASVQKFGLGSPYIKINGSGTASTTYGTVQSGDTLQVCATSLTGNNAVLSVPVTVGSFTTSWNVTTGNKTPDAFSFGAAAVPASVSMPVTNCTVANISGLTLPTLVTATADSGASVTEVNINNAGWTAYTGSQTIQNNQSLCVKVVTSNNPSQVHNVTVNIGGSDGLTPVSSTYTVTNPTQDTTPDAFSFTAVSGADASTLTTSNTITITGITGSVPVSVSGSGAPQISANGGAWTTSTTIQNNQSLQVRMTSSGSWATTNSATVTIGTGSTTWTVTTASCIAGSQEYTTAGSYTFTVPLGCTTVSAVAIGGGGAGNHGDVSGQNSSFGSIVAYGGGGDPSGCDGCGGNGGGGSGGDGGYTGGHGGDGAGTANGGGGGAATYTGNGPNGDGSGSCGAGVGLYGTGSTGSYGSGQGSAWGGGGGGGIRWGTVSVTPGQTIGVTVGTGYGCAGGAVRVIWGAGKSYPNNAN